MADILFENKTKDEALRLGSQFLSESPTAPTVQLSLVVRKASAATLALLLLVQDVERTWSLQVSTQVICRQNRRSFTHNYCCVHLKLK